MPIFVPEKVRWYHYVCVVLGFLTILSLPYWMMFCFVKVGEKDIIRDRFVLTAYYMAFVWPLLLIGLFALMWLFS